jgi:organic radical activating enzyme
MSKIKVSELFYSIQGEGRYMGVPSVFLRTFGCNFTCDGFGMPRGEKSIERINVALNDEERPFKSYKDLPLVSTGCDSYASWDPNFKHLSPLYDVGNLANDIVDLLPHKTWNEEHLVITGGEPLLGWQRSYPELLDVDSMIRLRHLTFETNGTQKLTPEFKNYLINWSDRLHKQREVTFSVSAKLPVSGEKWEDAILPEVVCDYEKVGYTYLKFVIASEEDLLDARQAVQQYRDSGFKGTVYIMPVGGVERVYNLNNRRVAEMALREGWRYSDRLQVPLIKNEWGT